MRWGLRPRWYGDTDAMLALGLTALNTRHFETDVPRKFFDCVGDVESELHLPVGTHVYGRADIWPHLQAMYEGYLADPTQVACRADWRSRYAVVSYLAGKHDLSARQLQALNWQLAATNLTGWGADVSVLPLEVAARTGSQAAAIAAAETSREQGDRAAAFKQYRALATGTDLDALTRSFVRDRLATLDLETRLQTHDWVDFLPTDTNFTGWFIERGNCQLNADGSLEVQSDVNGHLLYSRARLGRDFEVRGQFEVVRSSNHSFEGGLVMGLPQFETDNWYSLRIKRNQYDGDVTDFGKYWSMQRQLTPAPVNDLTNAFEFRFQHGKAAATVNHRPIFQAVAPPWTIDVAANGFHLGLGAFSDLNDTVIRYRNVQVRLP